MRDPIAVDTRPTPLTARLTSQLLAGPPARRPVDVAARLLAIQGQDVRASRLAIRARTTGLTIADVDAEFQEGSLVSAWLNRGTLHVVRAEDLPWLHALTAPQSVARSLRRLAQDGVSADAAERGVQAIAEALAEHGPLTRGALEQHVAAARVPTAGQALFHVIMLASLRGVALRGPMLDGEPGYVLVRDWLGPLPPVDRERALAELARRYLRGHGPADERDLAHWAGIGLREARSALAAIASSLTETGRLVDLADRPYPAEPEPKLLGPFDPLLVGWRSRAQLFGGETGAIASHGMLRAVALVEGRPRATWTLSRGAVEFRAFAPIDDDEATALRADADDVLRFLDR
jgi:hypothetical protein